MIPARAHGDVSTKQDDSARLSALMVAIQACDQGALGHLYDLTVNRAFAVAMRVLRNPADAEEAVCAAYQQLWEQASAYDASRGAVSGWLMTMVWTRAVDLARRRRAHVSIDDLHLEAGVETYTGGEDDSAQWLDAFVAGSAVRRALLLVKPVSRRLIELAFVAGLSHPEIADRMQMPLGTVKSHIRRGLAQLRVCLESEGLCDV